MIVYKRLDVRMMMGQDCIDGEGDWLPGQQGSLAVRSLSCRAGFSWRKVKSIIIIIQENALHHFQRDLDNLGKGFRPLRKIISLTKMCSLSIYPRTVV
jgi:hypothetical protein